MIKGYAYTGATHDDVETGWICADCAQEVEDEGGTVDCDGPGPNYRVCERCSIFIDRA